MIRWAALTILLLIVAFVPLSWESAALTVGSKKFTESVILGEMVSGLVRSSGVEATHYQELGGTQLVFQALENGEIDVYPEYTGTLMKEIFAGEDLQSLHALREELGRRGIEMSRPLGFNNTYAIGMLRERAAELDIESISDLARHPDLNLGLGNEFMDRDDGWPNLKKHYGLPHQNVQGLDHDLAYRQLQLGAIDALDVYSTDAKIQTLDLKVLNDDRAYFPRYDAVLLFRKDLFTRYPKTLETLLQLERAIDEASMIAANRRAEVDRESEAQIASDFLEKEFDVSMEVEDDSMAVQIWQRTIEHMDLVRKSLIPAIIVAVPLGVFAAKRPRTGQLILGVVAVVQTIPSLALLVILMPPINALGLSSIGIGSATAVAALFLYSLLPIVRNTFAGLKGIDKDYHETAAALGLPPGVRLNRIELPLASRSILAGIKTAAVINVGFATLGALIGAGGYGQPIITGIRLADNALILQGAVPAAVLALAVQGLFELAERFLVPRGLRL